MMRFFAGSKFLHNRVLMRLFGITYSQLLPAKLFNKVSLSHRATAANLISLKGSDRRRRIEGEKSVIKL